MEIMEILGIVKIEEKESKMSEYFKEKGYGIEETDEDQKQILISNIFFDMNYAIQFLGCSFKEVWNMDYLDLTDMILHKMKNTKGGD